MKHRTKELILCIVLQLISICIIPFVAFAVSPYIPCEELIDYFFAVTLMLFGVVGFLGTTIYIWYNFVEWGKGNY